MATWIALLRGINVGGKNRLPMSELKRDLAALGYQNVTTYIQSGNIVFETPRRGARSLSKQIGDAIESRHDFRPGVLVLSAGQLEQAIKRNPFPGASEAPKSLHFFFLAEVPSQPNLAELDRVCSDTEQFSLLDEVFYLLAPDGIARSKLAADTEKRLGVTATARNFRTVETLHKLTQRNSSG